MINVENIIKQKNIQENKRNLKKAGIKRTAFFFDKISKTEWITVVDAAWKAAINKL